MTCAAACGYADGEGAVRGGGVVGEVADEGGAVVTALAFGAWVRDGAVGLVIGMPCWVEFHIFLDRVE